MGITKLLILAAVPLSLALPERRACTKLAPSVINWLDEAAPDFHLDGNEFHIDHLTEPGYDSVSIVTFTDIPEGATGCMLSLEVPVLVESDVIASGQATQADVYTITPDNPPNATWNNQPQKLTKVAETIPFPTDTTDASFSTVLYSDSCRPDMSFLFEVSQWQIDADMSGEVGFANEMTLKYLQGQDTGVVGFYMEYDC